MTRHTADRKGSRSIVLGLAAALLFVATAAALAACHGDPGRQDTSSRQAKIIAHRGANKFAPENTIPAIEAAIEMGLDYVEIDVRTTRDRRMVLMHDSTVDDTTDGTGRVRDLTAAQIEILDAGAWFSPEFAGTEVPFLEAALEMMRGRIGAYVDVKDALPAALAEALRDAGMLEDSVIYDDPIMQLAIQWIEPGARVMPEVGPSRLYFDLQRILLDPDVVAVSWGNPTRAFIDEIHSHGIEVFMDVLGEMDDPDGMRAALALGVDALQTDHPDVLLEVMEMWE